MTCYVTIVLRKAICKKNFQLFLCLLASWKLRNVETRSGKFSDCIQNVWVKSCLSRLGVCDISPK